MRSLGDHVTECMIVELSRNQITKLLPKLKECTKYLKGCRKSILDNSKILIKCIEEETGKALNRIQDLQKAVLYLMSGKSVNKEMYEILRCFTFRNSYDISFKIENTKRSIENFYEFYDQKGTTWKECSEVIFSKDITGGLLSIDLDTFKLSNIAYAPKIGLYCHACKIDRKTYFFHGGHLNKKIVSEAYLINIKDKNYERLTDGRAKSFGGGTVMG